MRGRIIKSNGSVKIEFTDKVIINKYGSYDKERNFYGRCDICKLSFLNLSEFIQHFLMHERRGSE